MKSIKTESFNKKIQAYDMYEDREPSKKINFEMNLPVKWNYKGYSCEIITEIDEDVEKASHFVTTPSGEKIRANISPYDKNVQTVNKWIDAGMPNKKLYRNFNYRNEDFQ